MEKADIELLSQFIKRPGMYVRFPNEDSFVSFIQGFEIGAKGSCNFTQLIKEFISMKYKINYGSDGWPGQVKRLSEMKSISWTNAFTEIASEIFEIEKQK